MNKKNHIYKIKHDGKYFTFFLSIFQNMILFSIF